MRHVFTRSLFALLWLAAAAASALYGRPERAAFYALVGGIFAFSAYSAWKKGRGGK